MQLIVGQKDKQVICTEVGKGRRHDFHIFKKSKLKVVEGLTILADRGYQGIHRYHQQSIIPHKKPRKGKLTKEQKQQNRELASLRVRVENVIRCIKVFRILSGRYRNRRKRFGLRVNLIAGIYNYELKLSVSS
jgi:IS5 family transposase